MKAQCERCKEIVHLQFTVDGSSAIRVRCPACSADYRVEAPAAGTPASLTSGPSAPITDFTCPKCGEPQKRGLACRRCGLIFSNWSPAVASSTQADDGGEAAALFTACEAAWDDPARHDAFLAHCTEVGAWSFAAAAYRRQTSNPDRRVIALDRLEKVRERAEKALAIAPRMRRDEPTRNPMRSAAILAVVVALFIASVWFIGARVTHHVPSSLDEVRAR